jgi:hypothetical protein
MGLMDKIKGILFDEEPDDTEEVLPKRESKKNKFKKDNYVDAEDTITEVKVTDNEDRFNFDDTEEYKTISRTKLREDSYTDDEEEVVEHKETKAPIEPLQVDKIIERSHSFERTVVPERKEDIFEKEDRSRYELPPKKEVVHEARDYSKFINEAKNGIKKPFVVTPIISPVYGILDKNYKPEEIAEKNKPEKIEQVRERMFGPVSYQGEAIPEPTRYEETKETLTETLIKENKEKAKKKEEKASVESEFDTAEFEEIKEKPTKEIITDDYEDDIPTKPSVDIESLLNDEPEVSFDNNFDDEEDGIIKSDDKYFEDEEEPSKFEDDELPVAETKTRKEEPKESLDDTIETDLFNLIDSMYNSDERE